ncbi:MAG: tRNA 2-thiocytidine(32) synthetase TtcA, partial [Burkholderiaceae bacterium]
GGTLKAMPPKLVSDDGRHIVIRPLAYVEEEDLARYAEVRRFPIIPCNLCGSQDQLKRKEVKRMLAEWQAHHPGRVQNVFNAMGRVVPSHLMDPSLYAFAQLRAGVADPAGDIAFDEEPCEQPDALSRPTAADVIRFA